MDDLEGQRRLWRSVLAKALEDAFTDLECPARDRADAVRWCTLGGQYKRDRLEVLNLAGIDEHYFARKVAEAMQKTAAAREAHRQRQAVIDQREYEKAEAKKAARAEKSTAVLSAARKAKAARDHIARVTKLAEIEAMLAAPESIAAANDIERQKAMRSLRCSANGLRTKLARDAELEELRRTFSSPQSLLAAE